MTWLLIPVGACLAVVAAWGVLRPFTRSEEMALDPPRDPLEDERDALLRALRDLDEDRRSGTLSEHDYRALRTETESRAVSVLRAIRVRGGASGFSSELSAIRAPSSGDGAGGVSTKLSRLAPGLLAAGLVVSVTVPVLAGSITGRSPDAPITGSGPGTGTQSALAFFEQRVRAHPADVAARLDLAQRSLESGDARGAIQQYEQVLRLDPTNAEAHARLGLILFQAGRPEEGLRAVEQALTVSPSYAEALYFKGVILLQGLNRPREAVASFRAYLDAAQFGSRRDEVSRLLQIAERESSEAEKD